MQPKVHQSKRLVLTHHESLGCFEVRRINKKGGIDKSFKERVSFESDPGAACKGMDVPYSPMRTVRGITTEDFDSWEEYIIGIWNKFIYDQK